MEILTNSPKETQDLGQKIGLTLINNSRQVTTQVIALYGELGSGKTTFVQGLAKGLGFPHRIVSPTFLIIKSYELNLSRLKKLHHLDLYRLTSKLDLQDLGIDEIFTDPASVIVIEWAERLGNLLPKKRLDVSFAIRDSLRLINVKEY